MSEVMKLKCMKDKETKTTYRFIIQENDYNITGSIYVDKETIDRDVDVMLLKAKFKE